MKTIPLLIACLATAFAEAQQVTPALQKVINHENAFANTARLQSTRAAFLTFLADSSILFSKGKVVDGKTFYSNLRATDSSLLYWWPVAAGISAAGDMAFTTGPWQWSKDRLDTPPAAFGYFSTVWQLQADSSWKVLTDGGISFQQPEPVTRAVQVIAFEKAPVSVANNHHKTADALIAVEQNYVKQLNQKNSSFIASRFMEQGRIHRSGHWPYIGKINIKRIDEKDHRYRFTAIGTKVARSGDLGFTYGEVQVKTTGNSEWKTTSYLRVWHKEQGHNWKIVMDVLML